MYKFAVLSVATMAQMVVALSNDDVIFAVNCGGSAVKVDGISYQADTHTVGNAHTEPTAINGCSAESMPLYQSERWAPESFMYLVEDVTDAGDYVAVFKFSEVYFQAPDQKVFGLYMNDVEIEEAIDIYAQVGRYRAYDLVVPFKIMGDHLFQYNGQDSETSSHDIEVEFRLIDGHDNPKINAFFIAKGSQDGLGIVTPTYENIAEEKPAFKGQPVSGEDNVILINSDSEAKTEEVEEEEEEYEEYEL